jgi:hypothetical protein
MQLAALSVANYRGLRDVTIPLSRFGCLIGENNSGKSSFLQALTLFFSGRKLSASNFFDESKAVRISLTVEDISEADLARLADEHRARVAAILRNDRLVLVRQYLSDGKSTLLYNTILPKEERFSPNSISMLVKGQRPGKSFVDKVIAEFPELEKRIDEAMNQDRIKQAIQDLANSMPDTEKVLIDQPLPTGLENSILPMLPDPIYIPAVKDLADDIKTTESTPFGKVLSILLQAVEPRLPDEKKLFQELNAKLNRIQQPDGTIVDERLDEVKLIESTVEKYVQETFRDVALRITIPPPELKTVFSAARIYADDGVEGLLDSKGDGLRRAVVFSVLRAYVELKEKLAPNIAAGSEEGTGPDGHHAGAKAPQVTPAPSSYLLLFEEPELFLHPKAQHMLLDALRVFSRDHHVLTTTHSPMFFSAEATGTFVKLSRKLDPNVAPKRFTVVRPVDLSDMNAKDQFQMICFENNSAAFFAETVVLVEGDSDYLLMPHIAKTLNSSWNVSRLPLVFARIMGKGNIRRYRSFFSRFGVRVPVIADLDLLVNGFDHVDPSEELKVARKSLLDKVDSLIDPSDSTPAASVAKAAWSSGELRGLFQKFKERASENSRGECSPADVISAGDDMFAWMQKSDRLLTLKTGADPEMIRLKRELLRMLRARDVYVLERGAIEEYYPETIQGTDKPARAREFCGKMTTREAILDCCDEQTVVEDGIRVNRKEFELIFEGIFSGVPKAPIGAGTARA